MYLPQISTNDHKGDKQKGDKAVELFIEIAQTYRLNPEFVEDDTKENKVFGVDVWITISGQRYGVDVKSESKFTNVVCLEHQNRMGWVGSLFKDYAEFFAFEQPDRFDLYRVKDLRSVFIKLVNINGPSVCTKYRHTCWDQANNRFHLHMMLDKSQYENDKNKGKPNNDRFAYFHLDDFKDIPCIKLFKSNTVV